MQRALDLIEENVLRHVRSRCNPPSSSPPQPRHAASELASRWRGMTTGGSDHRAGSADQDYPRAELGGASGSRPEERGRPSRRRGPERSAQGCAGSGSLHPPRSSPSGCGPYRQPRPADPASAQAELGDPAHADPGDDAPRDRQQTLQSDGQAPDQGSRPPLPKSVARNAQ